MTQLPPPTLVYELHLIAWDTCLRPACVWLDVQAGLAFRTHHTPDTPPRSKWSCLRSAKLLSTGAHTLAYMYSHSMRT